MLRFLGGSFLSVCGAVLQFLNSLPQICSAHHLTAVRLVSKAK